MFRTADFMTILQNCRYVDSMETLLLHENMKTRYEPQETDKNFSQQSTFC